MKVVGITGGIGSGKTTVCKLFELLGIPVFYADDEAKELYKHKKIISKVILLFGKKILDSKKRLDKKKLAGIVFSHKPSLAKLNTVIHPEVKKRFEEWKKKQKDVKYVIKEAAIMIESGSHKDVDYLVSVVADMEQRIQRTMNRENMNESEVKKRISEQLSDAERKIHSDGIIVNDGGHSLIEQVLKMHRQFLKK